MCNTFTDMNRVYDAELINGLETAVDLDVITPEQAAHLWAHPRLGMFWLNPKKIEDCDDLECKS